jgi:TPR repeat protein
MTTSHTGITKDLKVASALAVSIMSWLENTASEEPFCALVYGRCLERGLGCVKDEECAVRWYRKAAENGFANAQSHLGTCYEHGDGVVKDLTLVLAWYRKAAELGNREAQFNLGRCYHYGRGVPNDETEAVMWFRKAAEQGFDKAKVLCTGSRGFKVAVHFNILTSSLHM